jgi:monoamine oxidase
MDDIIDFAIVGAGPAGTYLAWRLANASGNPNIHVFEETSRIGGRLLTVAMPGMTFNSELGGMRYTSNQLLLAGLVERLRLPSRQFKFETQVMYLRGRHLRTASIPEGECDNCKSPLGLPYGLDSHESEFGSNIVESVKYAIRRALCDVVIPSGGPRVVMERIRKKIENLRMKRSPLGKSLLSAREWALLGRIGTLPGAQSAPLFEIGFWNLLQHYLSSEAFLLVHDGLGYESIVANWNAAEAIPWFLSDFEADYLTLEKGMQSMVIKLASELPQESLHYGHKLTSVEQVDAGGERVLRLSFIVDEDKTPAVKYSATALARHVILAIPKEPLKKIKMTGLFGVPEWNSELEWLDLLDSVTAHALFKLFLGYESAWWESRDALGSATGRSVTDLPIRQVYYFAPDPRTKRAVVMASYSDEHYVDFWKPLLVRKATEYYYAGGEDLTVPEKSVLRAFGATERIVRKAHGQIKKLHPKLEGIPEPYVGLAKDWSGPPYFGGWHSWNPHRRPWEIRRKLVRPFASNVYVCGEAYSSEQGWVEGAFRSAELVLNELRVAPPDWIAGKEYKIRGYKDFREYIGSLPEESMDLEKEKGRKRRTSRS